jgi:hypothetical protein
MHPGLSQRLFHPICIIGIVILSIGFAASVVGLVVDIAAEKPSSYQGLLTFVLFPSVSMFGIAVVLLGIWLEGRRARKLERAGKEWRPRLDPRSRVHRRVLTQFAILSAAFVLASIVGAYHAYEFTESKTFCGELCHKPMEPQAVAHGYSPHSNVACVDCHVGPGVQGYIEAKVSGLRQLAQMIRGTYPKPIVAGREKVAIASESCEHCHRSENWDGPELDNRTRYGYDLANTQRSLRLLVEPRDGHVTESGQRVHWHANVMISYRATDTDRQSIPWVRVERPDGTSAVYEDVTWKKNGGGPLLEAETMTCVDCHSRPAHRFHTPDETINEALSSGSIDRSLPFIKKVAVSALTQRYPTAEDASKGIEEHILSYYRDNFAGSVLERRESLGRAIASVREIHRRNVFPEMETRWTTHADDSGHRRSPGCFRCHSGRHSSSEGKTLERDCGACHVFYESERDSRTLTEISPDGSAFHPFELASHRGIDCWTCHTDAASPYDACSTCHEAAAKGEAMKFSCSICHEPGRPKEAGTTCAPCHPVGASALHAHAKHGTCGSCHTPHTWTVAAATCAAAGCHADAGEAYLAEHRAAFQGVGSHMKGLPVAPR